MKRSIICLLCLLTCRPGLVSSQNGPAGSSAPPPSREEIDRTSKYLADAYVRQLREGGDLVGLINVLALSRIDHPYATEKLMEVASGSATPAVRAFAWEALHTRRNQLTPRQVSQWVQAGTRTAIDKGFAGQLRLNFARALAAHRPSDFDGKAREALLALLDSCDHRDPKDTALLKQLRKMVGLWRDKQLADALIDQLLPQRTCAKAEYVLGGLDAGIGPIGSADPRVPYIPAVWREVQTRWTRWLGQAQLTGPAPGSLEPYTGRGKIFPASVTVNPRDRSWYEDLELDVVHLKRLEICFAIDSTGSMESLMRWVSRDVRKMAGVFDAISKEIRIGVVFFRDEPRGQPSQDDYKVKSVPLTTQIERIENVLRTEKAQGGRGRGAAMLSAIQTALARQGFSRDPQIGRLIILISDTYPLVDTVGRLKETARQAAQAGFVIQCIHLKSDALDQGTSSMKNIAKWGGGTYIEIAPEPLAQAQRPAPASEPLQWGPVAKPSQAGRGKMNAKIRREFVHHIFQGLLPKDHWKRIDPLIDILLAYSGQAQPE